MALADRIADFLAGKTPDVGMTPADVVHSENKWRLLRYRSSARRFRTPVLLIPSLINRHYVLDLMPGKSFAEHLVAEGFDVLIVDWGTPGDEDRYLTFDTIVDRYLGRAVRVAARIGGVERVHLLGYCLGGTLTAIHAALHPSRVASLVSLAGPIGFHDDGLLSLWTRTPTFDVEGLVEACGNVPWPLMQASFHMLKPTMNLEKMVRVVDRAWDDEFLDGFFAIETWGNDNVSFPGAAYVTYVEELYRKDALLQGTLRVNGEPVSLSRITCPTMAVTFEHDYIVPWRSASVLLERVGAEVKDHVHLPGGHVGAVVSKKAKSSLWPKLTSWWQRFDQGLTRFDA